MAVRQPLPQHARITASAVALLLAAGAAPVLGAASTDLLCPDAADATLAIPATELSAATVSHESTPSESATRDNTAEISPTHVLRPQVKAAIRDVFSATVEERETAVEDTVVPEDRDETPRMNTRVPGIADNELLRYKRQMYRRDI